MVWPWYAFIASTVLFVITLVIASQFEDSYGDWNIAGVLASVVVAVAVLVTLIMGLVVSVGRHVDRISCRSFSANSGYTTKYVIYRTMSSECLALTKSGKWVPVSSLVGVAK